MASPFLNAWLRSALTILSVLILTVVALGLNALGVTDSSIVLTLLMSVVLCSWAFGLPYSVLASVLVILVHAYFFSVPIYSFEVYNSQHLLAFVFIVAVGLVVGTLSARLRDQVSSLAIREERLRSLHRLGQALSRQIERADVVQAAEALLTEILGVRVKIEAPAAGDSHEGGAVPLSGSQGILGWLTFEPGAAPESSSPDRRIWVETLLVPVTLALERVALAQERQAQSLRLEATQTRNTILHGISHDLRTPLTVISATAGSLLEQTSDDDPRRADLVSVAHESQNLVRQVENLLQVSSLASGAVEPRLEWVTLDDLVYPCLESLALRYPSMRPVFRAPKGESLCQVDETLVARALDNLLENAALHAPGPVEITVKRESNKLRFVVADRGPGVPEAEKSVVFNQFVRGRVSQQANGRRGSGLGLAIVLSIARLHHGTAGVEDRPGGGSVFWFEVEQAEPTPALWSSQP